MIDLDLIYSFLNLATKQHKIELIVGEEYEHTLIAIGFERDFSIWRLPSLSYRRRISVGGWVSTLIARSVIDWSIFVNSILSNSFVKQAIRSSQDYKNKIFQ